MSKICDDLRAAILQAAMQGKLTEQLPEDGNAAELISTIKAEKKQRKYKTPSEIKDSEKPFDIPQNWQWFRIGDVFETVTGGTPSKTHQEYYGGDYPFFKPSDLGISKYTSGASEYLSDAGKNASRQLPKDAILVCCIGSIGKTSIMSREGTTNQQINAIIPNEKIFVEYIYYALRSPVFYDSIWALASSTTISIVNKSKMDSIVLPLPPLAEQKRIVEKVDELMARVADLEKSADALASLKKSFPSDIRDALLQAAMQGKLTKQLPEDGDTEELLEQIRTEKEKLISEGKIKKQKPLAPITDDEIPFSIPENWKWVRLESIISFIGDKSNQIKESDVKEEGTFPVVSQSKEKIIGYCDDENKVLFVDEPVLVFGDHTALIKYIDFDFIVGADGVKIMKPIVINPFYLYYALTYNLIGISSIGGYSRHYKFIKDKLIPIPPQKEQERIVDKLGNSMQDINAVRELIASE